VYGYDLVLSYVQTCDQFRHTTRQFRAHEYVCVRMTSLTVIMQVLDRMLSQYLHLGIRQFMYLLTVGQRYERYSEDDETHTHTRTEKPFQKRKKEKKKG